MPTETKEDVYYALREKHGKQRFVRLDIRSNGDADFCNECQVSLSFYEDGPLYRASSPREAAKTLRVDTPWYNSSDTTPQWGSVDVASLEVIKVEEVTTTTTTPVNIELPIWLAALDAFSSNREVCGKALGRELPDDKRLGYWSVRVVELPADMSLPQLQEHCRNQYVWIGNGTPTEYYSWGAYALPPDDVSRRTNKRAVGIVTSANAPD